MVGDGLLEVVAREGGECRHGTVVDDEDSDGLAAVDRVDEL